MDVHIFDGQLLDIKQLINFYLELASNISQEDKLIAFEKLSLRLQSNANFNTIVDDYKTVGHIVGSPNHDPSNNLYADDLLYLCSLLVEKIPQSDDPNEQFTGKLPLDNDLISQLDEQFVEMSSGMCPQGRTHRLFQIIIAFFEYL